jgi:hypothetical protein
LRATTERGIHVKKTTRNTDSFCGRCASIAACSREQDYEHARSAVTADRLEELARALQCEPADPT